MDRKGKEEEEGSCGEEFFFFNIPEYNLFSEQNKFKKFVKKSRKHFYNLQSKFNISIIIQSLNSHKKKIKIHLPL